MFIDGSHARRECVRGGDARNLSRRRAELLFVRLKSEQVKKVQPRLTADIGVSAVTDKPIRDFCVSKLFAVSNGL